ncbi:SdpA family antimicrobial peptide system protein [Streptomyces sp. WAC07061]|nr:SdpA family antimicrobial peptide system protein [Streptomyces sp. WAC07061]
MARADLPAGRRRRGPGRGGPGARLVLDGRLRGRLRERRRRRQRRRLHERGGRHQRPRHPRGRHLVPGGRQPERLGHRAGRVRRRPDVRPHVRHGPAATEQHAADHPGVPVRVLVSAAGGVLLVGALLAGSVFFSLPSNVLSTRDGGDLRALSARLLPQSWAFFTKPPSDPEFVPYLVSDGGVAPAALLPNSRAENLYGLTRRQRAQGPEVAAMANQVRTWRDCEGIDGDCPAVVAGSPGAVSVENTSPVPTLCGRVVLVETRPVPWKFRDRYEGWRLDKKAAVVEATCSGND